MAWGLAVNLLLGALLLLAFPRFSSHVPERAASDPLCAGGVGLLILIAAPVALILIAVTIIGIPITMVGLLLYGLAPWAGFVYGGYTLGGWLLARTALESRWAALALGLALAAVVGLVPFLGGLARFLLLLVGLGALAMELRAWHRHRWGREPSPAAPV